VEWQDYTKINSHQDHTVVGNLKILPGFKSPQLGNNRDLLVYLPPSYEGGDDRYPVLYLHDGQNLFDEQTSFAGEWQVDETMEELSKDGLEAIMVGIPNAESTRLLEYNPFSDGGDLGGLGTEYIKFIIHSLKPLIDSNFRTLSGRNTTGILGSSMGGLISIYAFFHHPDIFGFMGAMSPSLWIANRAIFDLVQSAPFPGGRIYLDVGTREHNSNGKWLPAIVRSRRYYASVRRLHRTLVRRGYKPRSDILYVEEKWAHHEEVAWARRLPQAIRFFLSADARAY
jgi:predicted alpha/beta superfamily hydrolase